MPRNKDKKKKKIKKKLGKRKRKAFKAAQDCFFDPAETPKTVSASSTTNNSTPVANLPALQTDLLTLLSLIATSFRCFWHFGFDFYTIDTQLGNRRRPDFQKVHYIDEQLTLLCQKFKYIRDSFTPYCYTSPDADVGGVDYKRNLAHHRILSSSTDWFDDALVVSLIKLYLKTTDRPIQLIDPAVLRSSARISVRTDVDQWIVPICQSNHWYVFFIDKNQQTVIYIDSKHQFPRDIYIRANWVSTST